MGCSILVEPLSRDEIYQIHLASLHVLERVGVKVAREETLKLLDEVGAKVDYATKIVKFPPYLVKESLKNCPSEFLLRARNPKKTIRLTPDPERTYFSSGCRLNMVEDKKIRPVTLKDVGNWAKLGDYLKNVDVIQQNNATDVPELVSDLHSFKATISNTSKPCGIEPMSQEGVRHVCEMGIAILGDEEEFKQKPLFYGGFAATSPLEWDNLALEVLIEMAKYNIPLIIASEPIAGGTGPMSLAGVMMLANAEILSGIVILQRYKKGIPIVYFSVPYMMDLKTCAVMRGGAANALSHAVTAQLAHFYDLPSVSWPTTDSKVDDAQSGYESGINLLMHTLAGNDLVWGLGNMEQEKGSSFEQLVIDNEIVEMIKRVKKGVEMSDETLALDLIERVGIGGKFYQERHTLKYQKKNVPSLIAGDRHVRSKWEELGSKDMAENAKEVVKKVLETHEPEPLDNDVQKELSEIIRRATKELAKS